MEDESTIKNLFGGEDVYESSTKFDRGVIMKDKEVDVVTSIISKDLLKFILEMIEPPLHHFSLLTCSTWYYVVR